MKVFWQGGDRSSAEALLQGRPVIWVDQAHFADLVMGPAPRWTEPPSLTPREEEILAYVVDGWSNGEIADRLNLSLRTVKFHIAGLFNKLGVRRRTEAIREAHNLGLIRY